MTAATQWQALPVRSGELEAHYAEVRSYQADRARTARRSNRLAWGVAGCALLANLGLAWTVATTFPLVRIAPVYLWVRADGTVDSAVSMSDLPATQSQAVVMAAIWQYVRDREAYSYADAAYRYAVVTAMSSAMVMDGYQKWFLPSNPESPQLKVGKRGQVNIEKIGISFVRPQVALVRYWRTLDMYGEKPVRTSWSATVGFDLIAKMSASARLTDPGGLKVTSYQSSEDSP
jgi:type IV secretion system protein VirB8